MAKDPGCESESCSPSSLLIKGVLYLSEARNSDRRLVCQKKDVDVPKVGEPATLSLRRAVHEFMSPLDNHAFGIAKAKMRANRVDESDRIEPSLVFCFAGTSASNVGPQPPDGA